MELFSAPAFNGGVTSALGAMPAGRHLQPPVVRGLAGWADVLQALTPLAQQAAGAELSALGVPAGFIQGGQAIAYKAQGYNFGGGTVTLRSGVHGTPMVSPTGQKLLLLSDGGTTAYTDADVGAAIGTGGNPAAASGSGSNTTTLWIVGGAILAALVLMR